MIIKSIIGKMLSKFPPTNRWLEMRPYKKIIKDNPHAALLVMTPTHVNLGDHAISVAEIDLLNKYNIPFIELSVKDIEYLDYFNSLSILNRRSILICGGGNLGTLWFALEESMRKITRANKKSTIVILPNTIFYENTVKGLAELKKSKKIYNTHKKLRIYAREKTSYEYMTKHYRDVYLCPDMVLSLKEDDNQGLRNGCLLCLRCDIEKTRTDEQDRQLIEKVERLFGSNYSMTDMYAPEPFSVENREMALEEKFSQFKKAQLVITDRLHGMIFCAITATPCIVIDSKSPKVRGCYEWIKHLEYIKFADNIDVIEQLYHAIPQKEFHYDNSSIMQYYDEMMQYIKTVVERG